MRTPLEVDDFFLLLSTLLEERKAALRGRGRICFAVIGAGPYLLDVQRPAQIERRFDGAAETIVVCNRTALERLCEGKLEAEVNDGDEGRAILLWSGAASTLTTISKALEGARSLFDTRIAVMKGAL